MQEQSSSSNKWELLLLLLKRSQSKLKAIEQGLEGGVVDATRLLAISDLALAAGTPPRRECPPRRASRRTSHGRMLHSSPVSCNAKPKVAGGGGFAVGPLPVRKGRSHAPSEAAPEVVCGRGFSSRSPPCGHATSRQQAAKSARSPAGSGGTPKQQRAR